MYIIKDIPNFSNYQADSNGDIWNKLNKRKLSKHNSGCYLHVGITNNNGKRTKSSVHRLVAFAFHGLPNEPNLQIDHIDCNKQNNRPDNLEWVTPEENQRRADINGVSGKLFLSKDVVDKCISLYESYSINYISGVIKVSPSVIKRHLIEADVFDGRKNYNASLLKLTERDVSNIHELYKTGRFSNAQIADKLNNKVSSVMIGKYTMKLPYNRKRYRSDSICEMYLSGGYTVKMLSKIYEISECLIKKILNDGSIQLMERDIYVTKPKITDLGKFKEMIESGFLASEIMEHFNCGKKAYETARRKCKDVKYGSRSRFNPKELFELNKTMSQWAIAEKLGTTQPFICKIISKYKRDNNIRQHGNYKHGNYSLGDKRLV